MSRRSCQYSVIWPICSDGTIHPYVVNKQRQFFLLFLGHCGNCPRDSSRHENIVHNKYITFYYLSTSVKKLEPVAICDQVPSASLCDTFHFLHHQLLCVTSQKTQDYYTIKYTFPFCHKVSKWIFLIFQNLREFLACSAEALLPVLWGMIPNVGLS